MYTGRGILKYATRTSMAVPAPVGISVGDPFVLVALVDAAAITGGPGEVLVASQNIGSNNNVAVFGVIHNGSATYSVTWGGSSHDCQAFTVGFSGRSSSPFLTGGTYATGTGKTATAAAVAPPAAGYDLVALAIETDAQAATHPAGMTERMENGDGETFGMHAATLDAIGSGTTGTKAFTWAESAAWATVLVALAPKPEEVAGPRRGSLALLGVGR